MRTWPSARHQAPQNRSSTCQTKRTLPPSLTAARPLLLKATSSLHAQTPSSPPPPPPSTHSASLQNSSQRRTAAASARGSQNSTVSSAPASLPTSSLAHLKRASRYPHPHPLLRKTTCTAKTPTPASSVSGAGGAALPLSSLGHGPTRSIVSRRTSTTGKRRSTSAAPSRWKRCVAFSVPHAHRPGAHPSQLTSHFTPDVWGGAAPGALSHPPGCLIARKQ